MKGKFFNLFFFLILSISCMYSKSLVLNNEIIRERYEISDSSLDNVVFRNVTFFETVLFKNNIIKGQIMFYNCKFFDQLSFQKNNLQGNVFITSCNISSHLMISDNIFESKISINDVLIDGYLRLSKNNFKKEFSLSLSKIEKGLACFNNIFYSLVSFNNTDFLIRTVFYKNIYNSSVQFNDVYFKTNLFREEVILHSWAFADCIFDSNLQFIKFINGKKNEGNRSISFINSQVSGDVYIDDFDDKIFFIDLWQLKFDKINIDYQFLLKNIPLITIQNIKDPKNIEIINVKNPYKELSNLDSLKFLNFLNNIENGFTYRNERKEKIDFIKWQFNYENKFNNYIIKILNIFIYYITFENFLNIYYPIMLAFIICIIFGMIYYFSGDKDTYGKFITRYLKIDNYKNKYKKFFVTIIISSSILFNLPIGFTKIKEDKAKLIIWIEGIIGIYLILSIAFILGRIFSL